MKTATSRFVFWCILTCQCFGEPLPPLGPQPASDYFLKLRKAFASGKDYGGGWNIEQDRQKTVELFKGKKYAEFLKQSADWLAKCPVDAQVHLMRSMALEKAGDSANVFYPKMMYYGLMTSIVASGDGKTMETAYVVISVDEEYSFLQFVGADLTKQSLRDHYDVMDVKIAGKPQTVYFEISIPLAAEHRMLSGGKGGN